MTKPETNDAFLVHMVQQLSNVAFTQYFAGSRDAEVEGRLERLVRDWYAGDQQRSAKDPAGAMGVGRLFALTYVLPGFVQWVHGPALDLATRPRAEQSSKPGRCRIRPGKPGGAPRSPSQPPGEAARSMWEQRLLALVIREFAQASREFLLKVNASGRLPDHLTAQFRSRWARLEAGQPFDPNNRTDSQRTVSSMDALLRQLWGESRPWPKVLTDDAEFRRRRRERLEADPQRTDIDPIHCALGEVLRELTRRGLPPSTLVRRALRWFADWKTCERVFWGAGSAHQETVKVGPEELYRAWCELRLNQSRPMDCVQEGWEIHGRLPEDHPHRFYDGTNQPREHAGQGSELFAPDARLLLSCTRGDAFRRVWVQGDWDRPQGERDRRARLALMGAQARNLQCQRLVILTPWEEDWRETLAPGKWKPAESEFGLRFLMLPLVPHPEQESKNEQSLRHLFREVLQVTRPSAPIP